MKNGEGRKWKWVGEDGDRSLQSLQSLQSTKYLFPPQGICVLTGDIAVEHILDLD